MQQQSHFAWICLHAFTCTELLICHCMVTRHFFICHEELFSDNPSLYKYVLFSANSYYKQRRKWLLHWNWRKENDHKLEIATYSNYLKSITGYNLNNFNIVLYAQLRTTPNEARQIMHISKSLSYANIGSLLSWIVLAAFLMQLPGPLPFYCVFQDSLQLLYSSN